MGTSRPTLDGVMTQLAVSAVLIIGLLVAGAAALHLHQEELRTLDALKALTGPLARAVAGDLRSGNLPAIRHTQSVLEEQLGLRMLAISDSDTDPDRPMDLISGKRQETKVGAFNREFPSAALVYQDATQRLSLGRLELVRTRSALWGSVGYGLAVLAGMAIVAYMGVRLALNRLGRAVIAPLAELTASLRQYAGRDHFNHLAAIRHAEAIAEIDALWDAVEGADSHIQVLRQDWDLQRTALQSEKLVRQYVHELKNLALVVENPARKIRELLAERASRELSDDVAMELDIIDAAASALAGSPQELFSEVPVMGGRLRDEVFDVMDVLREVEALARRLGQIETIQVIRSEDTESRIRGDRRVLRLSLMNLVDNSARYAPGKSVTVTLLNTGKEVVLLYRDDGNGLSSTLARQFNAGGELASSHAAGWGTGLAAVRRNLLMMGGAAVYVPENGGGTFELRCERAPSA